MHKINISDLTISSTRQRREFDATAIVELADSIAENGLLHPIVVRIVPHTPMKNAFDYHHELVAGERRIKAIQHLWAMGLPIICNQDPFEEGFLPCLSLGELTDLEAEEAELEENIRRADLTWQERALATKRLADLREKQAIARGESIPSNVDIGKEVHPNYSTVADAGNRTRIERLMADNLDDPDIARAPSLDEAYKIAKRKEGERKNAKRAEEIGRQAHSDRHTLIRGNCLEVLRDYPPTFDVILSDPIYGMGADEFGDSGGRATGEHRYADSYDNWKTLMLDFAPLTFQVTKPQAHCYLFCDIQNFHELKILMEFAGWKVFRTPLIWFKPTAMRAPWPFNGPQRKYELVLYAVKGDKPVTAMYGDVLSYIPDANLGHQAQKPVLLFTDLLKRSAQAGDHILDAFCGSGPIFPAGHSLGCKVTGIEMEDISFGIAAKRLEELK